MPGYIHFEKPLVANIINRNGNQGLYIKFNPDYIYDADLLYVCLVAIELELSSDNQIVWSTKQQNIDELQCHIISMDDGNYKGKEFCEITLPASLEGYYVCLLLKGSDSVPFPTALHPPFVLNPDEELKKYIMRLKNKDYSHIKSAIVSTGAPTEFVFAAASCSYPKGFFYNNLPNTSFNTLEKWCVKNHPLQFVLFTGDQIYSDATAGLFDPTNYIDRFETSSRRYLERNASFLFSNAYSMLDDHEIIENWEPIKPSFKGINEYFIQLKENGITNYKKNLAHANKVKGKALFYKVPNSSARADFYVLDTRTERGMTTQGVASRTVHNIERIKIMSDAQEDFVRGALDSESNKLKFICSPSALFPRKIASVSNIEAAIHSDAWDGFPCSQLNLLKMVSDSKSNVVFVSGDMHIACISKCTIINLENNETVEFYSVHLPALYAPFPFANANPKDYCLHDVFYFKEIAETGDCEHTVKENAEYSCKVVTTFIDTGDAFTLFRVNSTKPKQKIEVCFLESLESAFNAQLN